ncbi:hypothetical protein [Dehalococcoides mccartyi]
MEAVIYEMAKRWGKTPWEMKQMPTTEFNSLVDMENISAFVSGKG